MCKTCSTNGSNGCYCSISPHLLSFSSVGFVGLSWAGICYFSQVQLWDSHLHFTGPKHIQCLKLFPVTTYMFPLLCFLDQHKSNKQSTTLQYRDMTKKSIGVCRTTVLGSGIHRGWSRSLGHGSRDLLIACISRDTAGAQTLPTHGTLPCMCLNCLSESLGKDLAASRPVPGAMVGTIACPHYRPCYTRLWFSCKSCNVPVASSIPEHSQPQTLLLG